MPSPGVVSDMQAVEQAIEDGVVKLHIIGVKNRECSLVANSFAGYAQTGSSAWQHVPFEFIKTDSTSINASKPAGYNDFSWWGWTAPGATSVLTTVRHECDGKIVHTSIGPFKLE